MRTPAQPCSGAPFFKVRAQYGDPDDEDADLVLDLNLLEREHDALEGLDDVLNTKEVRPRREEGHALKLSAATEEDAAAPRRGSSWFRRKQRSARGADDDKLESAVVKGEEAEEDASVNLTKWAKRLNRPERP